MEAIIGVIILFWIISSFVGSMGKQGQQRKVNRPKRPNSLPPFGNPSWPTLERDQPLPSSREYPEERRVEQEIYQPEHADFRNERKVTDGSGSNARHVHGEKNQENQKNQKNQKNQGIQKNDRLGTIASTETSILSATSDVRSSTNQHNHQKPALLDQEQLVNGIIWSEILGPPKSRRRS